MSTSDIAHEIAPILDNACREGRVTAASLCVVADGERREIARGMANAVEGIEATTDTLFHIGSATKSITAELAWKLILAGRLSVDMPVIAALPELSHIATIAEGGPTLLHLLSHTGGLDGDIVFDAGAGKDVLRRYMAQIPAIPRLCPPGAHFSYANIGYGILGRVVESNGRGAFEDLLATSLRTNHRLSQVGILPVDKIRQRTALSFYESGGEKRPDFFGPYSNIASGTVLAMSMKSLVGWAQSHFVTPGGERTAITKAMAQPIVALPHSHRYAGWGAGFTLIDDMSGRMIGHDGGTAGTSTFLRIAPELRSAWAFSATGGAAVSVHREIEPLLRRHCGLPPAPVRVPPGGPAPRDVSPYEGTYVRHGVIFTVKKNSEGVLTIAANGPAAPGVVAGMALHPLTAQVFELRIPALGASIWVSFHDFDANGKPSLIFLLERMARRNDGAAS